MSIAAIIVNYQAAELIERHLPQILQDLATVPGSHLFIVDNASPNGDGARLAPLGETYAAVTVIQASQNGGFAYGNNRGFKAAAAHGSFDHFFLLNPDAYPLDGCFATLVRFLDDHPKAGIVGSRLEGEDGALQCSGFRFHSIASEIEQTASLGLFSKVLGRFAVPMQPELSAHPADWVCGASMLIRASVLERIGGMDETYFLYFEEVDWQRAAQKAGFEIWVEPAARAVHLVGQSTDVKDGKVGGNVAPDYWYDSRRYYFRKNHGAVYGAFADVAWSLGTVINAVKNKLTGRNGPPARAAIKGLTAARRRKVAP